VTGRSAAAMGRGRALAALGLWLLLLLAGAVLIARTHFSADLSAFLPASPDARQRVLIEQLQSGIASRTLFIGIEGGQDAAQRAGVSRALAGAMRASGLFDQVQNGDAADWKDAGTWVFDHRYRLAPGIDAAHFTAEGLRDAIGDTLSMLGTPTGQALKPLLERDPTGETARIAESLIPSSAPRSGEGVWVSRSAPRAVLLATTHAAGSDLDAQARGIAVVRDAFEAATRGIAGPRPQLQMSGAPVFSVQSRDQIKSEATHLALVGGIVMGALLLLAFASPRALVIAVLPVATGVVAGTATVSLVFGGVHGLTMGFGSTLIGETVDYAIYYLIQARGAAVPGTGWRRWRDVHWPTVRLGLLTSVCGFAALVFSGFPGLAQLGVFSLAGLIAAALVARHVLPVLAPDGATGMGMRHHMARLAGLGVRALPRLRLVFVGLGICALGLVLWQGGYLWRADLGAMSPVPQAAQALDAELRNDIGASDASTLVVIRGNDEQSTLRATEAAGARLDTLVDRGELAGYESVSRVLPSEAAQAARIASLPDADTLRTNLAEALRGLPLSAARLDPFVADVQAARNQPMIRRAELEAGPLGAVINALMFERPDGGWSSLISLHPGAGFDAKRLAATLGDLPDVQVVNVGDELRGLYQRYLHEAFVQVMLGALAVVVLLGLYLRSGTRLLAVCQPLLFAVVLTLGGLALLQVPLGILHLIGLLLVVAVGSNYALFFDQLRVTGRADEDTLASLMLANLTTVVSFGLIAISNIPALSAIGRVVAPGALLALLLSAAFARASAPAASAAPAWPWPPFIRASAVLHVAAIVAGVLIPGAVPWAIGAIVLNHVLITAAGLTPRSSLLGRNITRLPEAAAARGEVALTIDDGPDPEVTPQVLDLLDAHGQRATFFCIAERAQAQPALAREIVERGHSIQNHTARHRHNFSLLGPRGFEREISQAQRELQAIGGRRPTCFRAPAGLRNPFLAPVLHRLGLTLVSWTRRGFDTRERDPAIVLSRLTRGLRAGDILLLHDGHAARTADGRPVVLEVLPLLLARMRAQGLHSVTLPDGLGQ